MSNFALRRTSIVRVFLLTCVMLNACARTTLSPGASRDDEVVARSGVATFALEAVLTPHGPAFAYRGRVGFAPTIRIDPGDRIEIALHNAMHPQPGHPNDVNLHFHGMSVSPRAPGDDVLDTLAHPGETIHYVVRVPRDHEPGLYWYHPHVHGEAFWQVAHGMSGAIIVRGEERHVPVLARMRERIVILRQRPAGSDITEAANAPDSPEALENADGNPCRPEIALHPTIDGQATEDFAIRPGEQEFFRVLNATASRYFDLSFDGTPVDLVGLDGVPLDAYPGAAPFERVATSRRGASCWWRTRTARAIGHAIRRRRKPRSGFRRPMASISRFDARAGV